MERRKAGLRILVPLGIVIVLGATYFSYFRARLAPGVTKVALLSVTPGMTHERVKEILGAPLKTNMYGKVESWSYALPGALDEGLEIFINFEGDRTTNIAVEHHDTTVYVYPEGGSPIIQQPEMLESMPR